MELKKILKLILFICFATQIINCQPNYQEMFLRANKFYKAGDFAKAYELYQKIPNPSPEVNYNLGNCAYKLEKYGYSLLYWRRAEKDWGLFNRSELQNNISLLKKKLDKSIEKNFVVKIKNHAISLIRSTPLIILQILFLICWLFLFLYLRYLYKRKQKILIILLFLITALLGTFLVIKYTFEKRSYGIIVSQNATLLSGPGKNFQELATLPQASEVSIQKSSDGFYKIKFNKLFGWTSKNNIEKI
jgi:tetratricopeptide (TPR) repeat protein